MTQAVKKIKAYLAKEDRTPAWLSRELGVSRAAVAYWLNNGQLPKNPEVRRKLKELCGVGDDWV